MPSIDWIRRVGMTATSLGFDVIRFHQLPPVPVNRTPTFKVTSIHDLDDATEFFKQKMLDPTGIMHASQTWQQPPQLDPNVLVAIDWPSFRNLMTHGYTVVKYADPVRVQGDWSLVRVRDLQNCPFLDGKDRGIAFKRGSGDAPPGEIWPFSWKMLVDHFEERGRDDMLDHVIWLRTADLMTAGILPHFEDRRPKMKEYDPQKVTVTFGGKELKGTVVSKEWSFTNEEVRNASIKRVRLDEAEKRFLERELAREIFDKQHRISQVRIDGVVSIPARTHDDDFSAAWDGKNIDGSPLKGADLARAEEQRHKLVNTFEEAQREGNTPLTTYNVNDRQRMSAEWSAQVRAKVGPKSVHKSPPRKEVPVVRYSEEDDD